jgi:hypothetical protein
MKKVSSPIEFPRLQLSDKLKTVISREAEGRNGEVLYGEKAALITAFTLGTYITDGGYIFHVDFSEEKPPILETDVAQIIRILGIAADTMQESEFVELLPKQPDSATICLDCEGSGVNVLDMPCFKCHGLKWMQTGSCIPEAPAFVLTDEGKIVTSSI